MSEPRTAGARFSVVDGIAIALGAVGTYLLRDLAGAFVWIIAWALAHFFLFCNVFRVRRKYELLWTACFFVNFGAWYALGFSWLGVFLVQLPITITAIALEVRSPEYHGIASRRFNPDLDTYLAGADNPY